MKPWEQYQDTSSKPWERYASQEEIVAPKETGFFADQRKRGAHLADIASNTTTDNFGLGNLKEQGLPEAAMQATMNEVGALGDAAGAGIGALAKGAYNLLPEAGQKRISSDIEKVSKFVAPVAQKYEQNLEAFNKQNPRAGRNLQAIRELANVLPLGNPSVRAATKEGLSISGGAVKNVAKDSAMYPVEGAKTVIKGMSPLSGDERGLIRSEFEKAANVHYKAVKDSGATLKPDKTAQLLQDINSELSSRGRLNPALHPKTIAILSDIDKDLKEGVLDVERIDQNRRLLSRVKPGLEGKEDYGAAQAAVRVINRFEDTLGQSDFINGSPDVIAQLKAGRTASHKGMKIDKISEILRAADGDPNRTKAGLTRFLNKKSNLDKNGKLIGFTGEEDFAVRKAAQSTIAEKLLKMGGKFGLDLGTSLTPGNTVAPLVGGLVSGSGGGAAAVIGVGTILRQLQKYMARGKADKVIEAIRGGKVPKEITSLPTQEAQQIIKAIRNGED